MKYVLVTGGVISGLGKGVSASSIGVLLKACGLRVTSIKIDPYLNTDAGTMSPFEHGEVSVLDDGGEVDLDLGNYERFLDVKLTRDHNITSGKVYQSVIDKERRGDYLGKTVQVVPHITDAIQEWIERVAKIPVDGQDGPPDVCVIEFGGTIGDIDSMPFIEAIGQFSYRVGPGNFCLIHVSLVPVLNIVGEQPTQHSVHRLRGLGLAPNMLACRSTMPLDENVKAKLSQFCHVPSDSIITLFDFPNIWHIPLLLRDQKAHGRILKVLNLHSVSKAPVLDEWTERARRCDMLDKTVKIAMVGKYTGLSDSYLSVLKALFHASVACKRKLVVNWVPASDLEEATKAENSEGYRRAWNLLKGADGVLVPGEFGDRGLEGELLAAKYALENKIPYLGVCFGMQTAVLEFAHSVLGVCDASRPLQKMLGTDLLSSTDAKRLQELGVVFESTTESGFLSVQAEGSKFDLIYRTDSSIPDGSITPLTSLSEIVRAVLEPKRNKYAEKYRVNKLSLALSDYLLPLDEGDDQIEIRSPVPGFPPAGQLAVVSSNDKRKKGVGEYCLAACEDGIVRWLHESECVNKRNHVWTVHWFDLRGGGVVYFGDRLQRFVRDVHNYFINTYIGGNVNGSGTQNIGTVNTGTQNIGTVNTGTQNIGTVNTLRAIVMHRFLLGICLLYLIGSSIVGKSLLYFLFLASKNVRRNFE